MILIKYMAHCSSESGTWESKLVHKQLNEYKSAGCKHTVFPVNLLCTWSWNHHISCYICFIQLKKGSFCLLSGENRMEENVKQRQ
jgi:hypothetical protein